MTLWWLTKDTHDPLDLPTIGNQLVSYETNNILSYDSSVGFWIMRTVESTDFQSWVAVFNLHCVDGCNYHIGLESHLIIVITL